jgi:hypothetical protein
MLNDSIILFINFVIDSIVNSGITNTLLSSNTLTFKPLNFRTTNLIFTLNPTIVERVRYVLPSSSFFTFYFYTLCA